MPKNPPDIYPPSVVADLEAMTAEGVFTYLSEYSRRLFADYRTPQAQDIVLAGIARAIRQYEAEVGRPICRALAFYLLDNTESE